MTINNQLKVLKSQDLVKSVESLDLALQRKRWDNGKRKLSMKEVEIIGNKRTGWKLTFREMRWNN
jgi:hypothetical protein